jgi:hypothetical protein
MSDLRELSDSGKDCVAKRRIGVPKIESLARMAFSQPEVRCSQPLRHIQTVDDGRRWQTRASLFAKAHDVSTDDRYDLE